MRPSWGHTTCSFSSVVVGQAPVSKSQQGRSNYRPLSVQCHVTVGHQHSQMKA